MRAKRPGANGNRGEKTQGANGIRGETTRYPFIWISHSERIISYSFMYTAVPASLTVLSDNRLFFFKSSVISPNKQSQNANLSRVFTQI